MNELDRIFEVNDGVATRYITGYFSYLAKVLGGINVNEIEKFIQLLLYARENANGIFFIGNGGSAATASHFANDLAIGTSSWHKPFKAVSLTDNMAMISAIANDDGYNNIFVQQLNVLGKSEDLLVAISASGNSQNIINAIEYAKKINMVTVGLSAFDGGRLRQVADHNVYIPTGKGEYGPAEDSHMIMDHLISSYLMRHIRKRIK